MEEILKEILTELKKINYKLDENNTAIRVSIDEDALVEKVINNINKRNRTIGKPTIVV